MLTLALNLVFLTTPQSAASKPVEWMLIAMTRDGVRLEVEFAPAVGARDIKTAFGTYSSPLDPVAVVMKFPRETKWRQELIANPAQSLIPSIAQLDTDGRVSELIELTPMLEARLLASQDPATGKVCTADLLAATEAVSRWGSRLDPLPSRLSRDKRVKELWKRTRAADGARTLLLGSRLLAEVETARDGVGDRQLGLSDIGTGMRSRSPYLRYVAMQISSKQLMLDSSHNAKLLIASVEDEHVLARAGAAKGSFDAWPREAVNFWKHVLGSKGSAPERIRAARHLARHLKKDGISALKYALSGQGQGGSAASASLDVRKLAQAAARDCGVTEAQIEQERFDARRGAGSGGRRLVSQTPPRGAMDAELEAEVARLVLELSRRL